jgi:hypothetical protein
MVGRRLEWRMENGEWRMEDGGWRMEDGEWRMENRGWRMENGEWRDESGRELQQKGARGVWTAPNCTKLHKNVRAGSASMPSACNYAANY